MSKKKQWLAGMKYPSGCIIYACLNSTPEKVGWSPYSACAQEYDTETEAQAMAEALVEKFPEKDPTPVVEEDKRQ